MKQNSRRAGVIIILIGLMVCAPAGLLAQSRQEQQILADTRQLQEQVQRLMQVVGALAETLKASIAATTQRLDEQANTNRTNYANLKQLVDALTQAVTALRDKTSDVSVNVGRLNQEQVATRKSLEMITDLLTQTLAEVQPAAGGAGGSPMGGSPAAPPQTSLQAVASPSNLFDSAFSLFTMGQFDLAIEGFQDYLKRFPDSVDAAKAQFYIGLSYVNSNPSKDREAVAAYGLVTATAAYKGSEYVPQAYYSQAGCYERLKQIDLARKNYQTLTRDFKDSPYAILAEQRLQKLGGGELR